MNQTERFYRIIQLLKANRAISTEQFLDDLEVSKATFKRDLDYLKDRFHAPISWNRELMGYVIEEDGPDSHTFELPGLWFNASEVFSLMTMAQLLESLQPGLLKPHIEPLRNQIKSLLDRKDYTADEVQKRIRILTIAARQYNLKYFEVICYALLTRKRLNITSYNRERDNKTNRDISPQRIVYYRDNWYLDAWCHLRNNLRTFSVDTIEHAELLKKKAKHISDNYLDNILQPGYGIFSGNKTEIAKLRFTPERSRWVAREKWHPEQNGKFDTDGYYILEIPYSDHRELIMDIMKHGPHVEILEPVTLVTHVVDHHKRALEQYIKT